MRFTALLLSASTLLAAAETAPAPAADPVFTVRPQQISIQRSRYWQQDGRSNDNSSCQVTLAFHCEGRPLLLGWQDLVVTEAVTDTGEKLGLRRNDGNRRERIDQDFRRNNGGDGPAFQVGLYLDVPSGASNGLASITGSVTVQIAAGPPKRAELKPFKDIRGKLLEIAGVPGAEVSVENGGEREGGKGVCVRYPAAIQEKLLSVAFFDGAGQEIRSSGWGGGESNDEVTRTYHVRLPEDGAVVLSFAPETRKLVVPFQAKDILLGGTQEKARRERLKIEAKVEAPAPTPAGEKLDVKPVGGGTGF